jgi:hypothetical protein
VSVNYEPRRGQAVGRVVIKSTPSTIVRPDETKGTTKLVLLDAVGPDFAEKGLKVGDVVLPSKVSSVVMEGGASFRPVVNEADVILVVRNWTSLSEFRVQTESGAEYVAFDDPRAAPSLGFVSESQPTSAAA